MSEPTQDAESDLAPGGLTWPLLSLLHPSVTEVKIKTHLGAGPWASHLLSKLHLASIKWGAGRMEEESRNG